MSVSVLLLLFSAVCLLQARTHPDCESLYLTPMVNNGNASIARELSKVDPALFLGFRSHSGFITVKEEYQSNLFFWYFPHEDVATVPWIIWLNGGPGVSSLIGLFDLIGPVKIEEGKVVKRNVTWLTDYSLLFIDNPVGAGFSFTEDDRGYTYNEDQVSEQLYELLQQFLEVFPEQREAPLFIAGQSYAGKYVPAFAVKIHRNNNKTNPIKLKGIMLGNPLIDLRYTMHYSELIKELGLHDGDQIDILKDLEGSVVSLVNQNRMVDAANKFNETIEYIKKTTHINIYNILEDPTVIKSSLEEFVKHPDVRCAIHVGNASFDLNNQVVYTNMLADFANTSLHLIEELLPSYAVLVYSGQLDLILPYSNSLRVFDQMQWPSRLEYVSAQRTPVRDRLDSKVFAYKKAGGNFFNVMIRGCGHMVPKEKPEALKYIVKDYINYVKKLIQN